MWYNAYTIEFRDIDEGLWTILIQSQEAPSDVISITPSKKPFEWKGKAKGEQNELFLPTTGTLRLWITEETIGELKIGKLFPSKFNDRRIIAQRNGVVAWQGFLLPETYDQDWVAPPFEIELSVCDTVSALQYVFIDGEDSSTNIIQLLHTAYKRVGGELSVGEFLVSDTQLYYARNGAPTSRRVHWGSGEVFPSFFIDPEGKDKKNYRDVIEVLLSPYGRLRQIGSRWYVGTDAPVSASLYKPNANGAGRLDGGRMATIVVDMDDEIAGKKNTESILPPPSKVTLKYEPEDGAVDYSGDQIVKMDSDVITSSYSNGPRDMAGLRYMDVSPENLKWPFIVTRFAWWQKYEIHRVQITQPMIVPTGEQHLYERAAWDSTGFSQVLEHESGTWAVKDGLVLGQRRSFTSISSDTTFSWEVSVDQFRMQREVLSSEEFCVKLKLKSVYADLQARDEYSPGNDLCIRPYVQVYYCSTPNGTPTKVLRYNGGGIWWESCSGFFTPPYDKTMRINGEEHDTSLISVAKCESGLKFGIPNGRGYISFRVYAGSWIPSGMQSDILFNGGHSPLINAHSILSELDVTYSEVISDATHHLLEWNKEVTSTVTTELSGGTEELDLEFKTLAGDTNTAETYLAPRRGFSDSKNAYCSRPRFLLDIGAVSLKNFDLAGLAYPAVFRFNGEAYFPLSVGMDCRMNRVSLKLIRTL